MVNRAKAAYAQWSSHLARCIICRAADLGVEDEGCSVGRRQYEEWAEAERREAREFLSRGAE